MDTLHPSFLHHLFHFICSRQCALCSLEIPFRLDKFSLYNNNPLCDLCTQHLPRLHDSCQVCCAKIPQHQPICGECLQHPPFFDKSVIPFEYQYPLDHWINAFKFHNKIAWAQWFAEQIIEKAQTSYEGKNMPNTIIPVPLHKKRHRQRGYNQALLIAKKISTLLNLSLETKLIDKTRATKEQSSLTADARQYNIKKAFSLRKQPPQRVILLDDVVTTTSTVSEIARLLKQQGCKEVHVWAIARASLSNS